MLDAILEALKAVPIEKVFEFIGTLIAVLVVPLIFRALERQTQEKIKAITHGAYLAVSAVAASTDTKLDDLLALVIERVEIEMGRQLKPAEVKRVVGIALALHGDPDKPSLGTPSPSAIEQALRTRGNVLRGPRP